MSKRSWRTAFLTPWLLASTGCSTFPFGSSTAVPLAPERRLAIAQTFEKQGHTTEAKAIYEQIAASTHPASAVAAQRLESLIAKQTRKASSQLRNQREAVSDETAIAKREDVLQPESFPKETTRDVAEATSSRQVPAKTSVDSTSVMRDEVDFQVVAAETAVMKDPIGHREKPTLPDPVEIPPSPMQAIEDSPELASTETASSSFAESNHETDWSLPVKVEQVADAPTFDEETAVKLETIEAEPKADLQTNSADLEHEVLVFEKPVPSGLLLRPQDSPPQRNEVRSDFFLPSERFAFDWQFTDDAILPVPASESKDTQCNNGKRIPSDLQFLFFDFRPEHVGEITKDRARSQGALLAIAIDREIDQDYRSRAIFLLGQMGADAEVCVKALTRVMYTAPTKELRIETAETILSIQPANEEAVRFLLEMLKNDDVHIRWYATFALRMAAAARPEYVQFTISRLLECMDTGDVRYRRMAMLSLGAFGSAAEKAIPRITAALEDPDETTRIIAANSLKLINPPPSTVAVGLTANGRSD